MLISNATKFGKLQTREHGAWCQGMRGPKARPHGPVPRSPSNTPTVRRASRLTRPGTARHNRGRTASPTQGRSASQAENRRERSTGMHCGVMVTGYNQGDWERLLREDYSRPPTFADAANMDDTLYMGELVEPLGFDSIWATEH